MRPNFIDYYLMKLIPLEKGRVGKEQGMLMGWGNRTVHDYSSAMSTASQKLKWKKKILEQKGSMLDKD